ncbi:Defective in cullin neddylation protein 1 [Ceratocystis lukuohia]|uniref:Defective in cullin neddylation protein n=1 Tax=Ceratocystis lukuohia TaxID=2019550 RepID=A0ABR4MJM2_9PEZI
MPTSAVVRSLTSQFQIMTGDSEKTAAKSSMSFRDIKQGIRSWKKAGLALSSQSRLESQQRRTPQGYVASNNKYSQEAPLNQIFNSLRGASDPKDSIGIESSMTYLAETLNVNLENAEMFVALEAVRAPSIGQITRQGFMEGWSSKGIDANTKAHAAYIRDYTNLLSRDPGYFKTVYRYAFVVGKEPDQKSLSLENATIYWNMLFGTPGWQWKTANYDWLSLWVEYLNEHYPRPVNKDMWNQTLEFARKAVEDETLSFWNEDGAWPSVIDGFVAWFYEKFGDPRGKAKEGDDEESD